MKPQRTIKMPLKRAPGKPRPAAPKLRARAADDEAEIEDYEGEAEPNMRFSHALFVVLILHVIAVGGVFAFNSIKARQTSEAQAAASAKAPSLTEPGEASAEKKPEGTTAQTSDSKPSSKPEAGSAAPGAGNSYTVIAGDTLSKIANAHKTSVEALEEVNGITSVSVIRVGQVLQIPTAGFKPAAKTVANTVKTVEPTTKTTTVKPTATKPIISSVAKPVGGAAPAVKPASEPSTPAAPAEKSADGTYTVMKGDNPYSIAKKFHVSYKSLLEVNNIEDPTKIQIGQKLKIPNSGG
jgi:LysM repeat protein